MTIIKSVLTAIFAGFVVLVLTSNITKAATVTMDELPLQSLNGVSLKGVTFVTSDSHAFFNNGPGGSGLYVTTPISNGVTSIDLTLDFASNSSFLNFGFVLSGSGSPGNNGVSVELFDSLSNSLGVFTSLTSSLTDSGFEEGFFTASANGIRKAVINFAYLDNPPSQWTLDNVEFNVSVVPLPSAFLLYGSGMALLGFFGWKRGRRKAL